MSDFNSPYTPPSWAPSFWATTSVPVNIDRDLRLECARLANGDIDKAKEIYAWVKGEKE